MMRWLSIAILVLVAQTVLAEESSALKTQNQRESYTTGVNVVRTLMQQGGQIDLDLVIKGMQDGLTGQDMLLSEAELRKITTAMESANRRDRRMGSNAQEDMTADVARNSDGAPAASAGRPGMSRDREKAQQPEEKHGVVQVASQMPAAVAPRTLPDSGQQKQSFNDSQQASNAIGLTKANQAWLRVRERRAAARSGSVFGKP